MEILLCEVNTHFPVRFAPIILANRNAWRKHLLIEMGKCAIALHSCISVKDRVKINEQKISIATGPPLYVHTVFEVI